MTNATTSGNRKAHHAVLAVLRSGELIRNVCLHWQGAAIVRLVSGDTADRCWWTGPANGDLPVESGFGALTHCAVVGSG